MKVLFLTANLSPGLDGVGDYTCRLARGIVEQGHQVALLSMNERNHNEIIEQDDFFEEILRLPAGKDWKEKEELARNFIEKTNPDFISLQCVIYGWHDRGLPLFFPRMLVRLTQNFKLHIMFHELSIGISEGVGVKENLIGFLQRSLVIKPMLRLNNIRLIDTQATIYQRLLQDWTNHQIGLKPLFGNIPIVDATEEMINQWVQSKLSVVKSDYLLAGYFGSIDARCLNKQVFEELKVCADKQNKKLMICSAGGIGKERESEFLALNETFSDISFVRLGRLEAKDASFYFLSLNIGLSGTSYLLAKKAVV
ncbi:putative Glycosyltransferase involved in cell wall bisynthesis [uncultured Thiomicrorhabdus sp.]